MSAPAAETTRSAECALAQRPEYRGLHQTD
jgi:hypothetical protein